MHLPSTLGWGRIAATVLALASPLFALTLHAQCDADGGGITLANGATETSIVVDGVGDPLDVLRDGMAVGAEAAWVITDAQANILALPPSGPPFDLDGAGVGTCLIWYLRHDGTLTGAAVGANAATDLGGCYDLSNAITVQRLGVDDVNGGNITLADGSTSTAICVDGVGDPLEVLRDGTANGDNAAWVITDDQANILALPPNGPPFDLDPAGPGTCLIWYLRYNGAITGAEVGMNAANLGGDFDLSNPITVIRNAVDGGGITLADGSTSATIVVDGTPDPLDVLRDGTAVGAEAAWVITDAQANILALPPNGPPFDLDGAGVGTCLIWYLRYEDGLTGAEVGNNVATDLDGCYDLSNPITVDRQAPTGCNVDGGNITLADGGTSTTIVVDGTPDPLDVLRDGTAVGAEAAWVITDAQANILALPPNGPPFDLDGAGVGTCLIWYLRHDGTLTGAAVGANAATDLGGCYDLSNPITVDRRAPGGGAVQTGTVQMPSGATTRYTCPGNDGPIVVDLNYTPGGDGVAYVITDSNFDIIGIQDGDNSVDASAAPPGVCYVFAFAYTGTITAQTGDRVYATQFSSGTWLISQNAIRVVRAEPDGGTVSTQSSETTVYTCAGDGLDDYVGFRVAGQSAAAFTYVITDDQNRILLLNDHGFQNFEGAGSGVCRVWGLSYTGRLTAQPGDDAGAVALSDRCYDLSDNFITVDRASVDGGTLTAAGGGDRVTLGGGTSAASWSTSSTGTAPYAYFVLDQSQTVRAVTFDASFDFAGLGDGTYFVYGVSHQGPPRITVGEGFFGRPVTDYCWEQSGNAVVVEYSGSSPAPFTVVATGPRQLRLTTDRELADDSGDTAYELVRVSDQLGRVLFERRAVRATELDGLSVDLPESRGGLHVVSFATEAAVQTEKVMLELR